MKHSVKRNVVRLLHLSVGSVIATYIYSPWGEIPAFQIATKAAIIPLTVLSGLWLWKGHVLRDFSLKKINLSIFLVMVFFTIPKLNAQETKEPEMRRWGGEFSLIGAGVFGLAQGKVTYVVNPNKRNKTEIGLGYLFQPESNAKANEGFNNDGLYSACMASLGLRQFIWKGLHFEEVANFGRASVSNNKVDGKNYESFVIFSQTFIGYKFNIIKRQKVNFFLIAQGGIGYVPFSSNQWPTVVTNRSSVYGLGDLKIGINF